MMTGTSRAALRELQAKLAETIAMLVEVDERIDFILASENQLELPVDETPAPVTPTVQTVNAIPAEGHFYG